MVCSIVGSGVCSIDNVNELYDFVGSHYSFVVDRSINTSSDVYMSFIDMFFKLLIPIVNNIFCLHIMIT
ncbi:MAG: hypothetical protein LBV42_01955 [Methanobrevibacter sp.]|nr:hypothetical protein [Methanobrevibacter sp.]